MDAFIDGLLEELQLRDEGDRQEPLHTLYLGGGTPSLLPVHQLDRIMNDLHRRFSFREHAEITIECNPDHLERSYLEILNSMGFNRLSIGIQSFQDRELTLMRRSHSADQAENSVWEAADAGFSNITADLIYGIPGQELTHWEQTLNRALSLPLTHLSAYHLTFEPGTVFDQWRKKGKLSPPPEEVSSGQFEILRQRMQEAGFDHYEISNFARDEKRSEHNMLYWSGDPYMGVGPSAHSFDGNRRRWNVASIRKYTESIHAGEPFWEEELLTTTDRYHDYLITALRTRWGVDLQTMEKEFGGSYADYFEKRSAPFLESGALVRMGRRLVIPAERWLITDHILRELFFDDRTARH